MENLFGTDGIRGIPNRYPLTVDMIARLGRAMGYLFRDGTRRHKFIIGKDTRLSGYMLEMALSAGLCSMGADVLLIGPLPTPGVGFITTSMRADAGFVITASHNPFDQNGIKIFDRSGLKISVETERKIEAVIFNNEADKFDLASDALGRARRIVDAIGRYNIHLKKTIPQGLTFDGLKVVLDCANGATYRIAPMVMEELGAGVVPLNVTPDGTNINRNCGALYPEEMAKEVVRRGADIGFAYDGDGDRVIIADDKGRILDGDFIMGLFGVKLKEEGRLLKNTIITTSMSNMGLELFLKGAGIKTVRVDVGDKNVIAEMLRGGYNFGGEQSGHIIFLDHSPTGDGILTSLQILSLVVEKGIAVSKLFSFMEKFPQSLRSIRVKEKIPLSELSDIRRVIRHAEQKVGDTGRVVVRYSGTENKLRIMVEGPDEKIVQDVSEEIVECAERLLGTEASE